MVCKICNNKLRSDNTIGYCRNHRNISPIFKEKNKIRQNLPENVQKRKDDWKLISDEERIVLREKNKISSKKYRNNNKDKRSLVCIAWNKNNPDKFKKIAKRSRDKIRSTPKGVLNHRMEVAMNISLKGNKNGRKWESLVGYTINDLKLHIEKQFKDGMSWELLIQSKIHIDHIIPKSHFNYSTPEDDEFKKCWGLENLQPLWAKDNLKKSNKI